MLINGLDFRETSFASPEQYDVFDDNGIQVGYVRLRFGCLRADFPYCGCETVYRRYFNDDDWKGCFDSDEERIKYLTEISDILQQWINGNPVISLMD